MKSSPSLRIWPFFAAAAVLLSLEFTPGFGNDLRAQLETAADSTSLYHSQFLDDDILVLPDVFSPRTAERRILPFMKANQGSFEGSIVLDIGTGSGIIALYAARLGAAKVVATDISEAAIECTRRNAGKLGYSGIIEPRLVPPSDMSAYSVIGSQERFDVIVSNPPYFLDLDAGNDPAFRDSGDLGFSIIRGLTDHLSTTGQAILLYGSTFYHQIIVKFAQYLGYQVKNFDPGVMYQTEALTLWNCYLQRILDREGLEPDDLYFDRRDVPAFVPRESGGGEADGRGGSTYPGIIVIRSVEPGRN